MSTRVTIVTPSYNQAEFLEETILSVLGQDYPEIEYIVVDGGSTDGSVEIVKRYADRLAWWVSEPDGGQTEALNKGFARATGDYVGWINSDDTLLPGAVSTAVAALNARPDAALAFGDAVVVDEQGGRLRLFKAEDLDVREMLRCCRDPIVQQGALIRRDALDAVGGVDESLHTCFDFKLMVALGLRYPSVRIDAPLGTYRLHPASKSMSDAARWAADFQRMYADVFARELPREIRAIEREARSRAGLAAARLYYNALQLRSARRAQVAALRLYPRHATPAALLFVLKTFLPARVLRPLQRLRGAQLRWSGAR